jgi:hypothetical protein
MPRALAHLHRRHPRHLPGRLAETQVTLTGGEQPGPFGRKELAAVGVPDFAR